MQLDIIGRRDIPETEGMPSALALLRAYRPSNPEAEGERNWRHSLTEQRTALRHYADAKGVVIVGYGVTYELMSHLQQNAIMDLHDLVRWNNVHQCLVPAEVPQGDDADMHLTYLLTGLSALGVGLSNVDTAEWL